MTNFLNRRSALRVLVLAALISAVAVAIQFPWDVDEQGDESVRKSKEFYREAYAAASAPAKASDSATQPLSSKEQYYIDNARKCASDEKVPQLVAKFVSDNQLADKKVLEVGAGSGFLQDIVADYTALDISPTARRFFHKPFFEASATEMPFEDGSFDGAWTIWVLEHIPNPEKALIEMRRVVKSGGYLFLMPAFAVSPYLAQGYAVRPYSDFGLQGKMVKAMLPVLQWRPLRMLYAPQIKLLRSLSVSLSSTPSRLHFKRLNPNYEQYWEVDSDAAVSLSVHEMALWFKSRGDECLNCPSEWQMISGRTVLPRQLIIRVKK